MEAQAPRTLKTSASTECSTLLTLTFATHTTPTMHTQSTRRAQQGTQTIHQHIHRVTCTIRHETLNRLNAGADQEPQVQHMGACLRFEQQGKEKNRPE